ncbi:MAG: peptide chain release factor 1 [bacterium]
MNPEVYKKELAEIKVQLEDPSIYSKPEYPALAKRANELEGIVALFNDSDKFTSQEAEALQMISEGGELGELAAMELDDIKAAKLAAEQALQEALIPKDPNAEKDCIIEIRAGAGGDEASLFAAELYRMYARYSEVHRFRVELISESPSEVGGYKEIIFGMKGENAYKTFHLEAGVHRVQRVPATESQGRVHTSTVTVAVLPEAEETDVEVKDSDLRVDYYRAGGHGGQSVNTTDSAVRITHVPTGIVVTNQDEKSQIKNKLKAMSVLRSRLLQFRIDAENEMLSAKRKALVGSGDRSEKIRTYNFPQDRITDHRIGYSRSNIPGALSGQIDDLIEELKKAEVDILRSES